MKKFKRSIALALILVILGSGTSLALRKSMAVSQFTQQPYDQLCWATSSSMVISYLKGDRTDRKIAIAKAKHGNSLFNKGASLEDSRNAIKTYTSKTGTITNSALSYTSVKNYIDKKRPIISRHLNGSIGHQMVIKGYDTGSNGTSTTVIYNDPWDGKGHAASYNYFKSNKTYGQWNRSLYFTN